MTERTRRRSGDRLLWIVFGASAAVALATLAATKLIPPTPLPAGRGGLPRMRVPQTSQPLGDLLRMMGIGSLTWYASVLSAPLFIWMSRRLPFDRKGWLRSSAIHLLVVVSLVLVTAAIQHRLSYAGAPMAPSLMSFMRAALLTGALPFVTVAAAAHALEARARAQERELDAARVKGQLAEARLEALTAQLQPHFLFNTLQGISTLLQRDPVAADRMLASLSDLLREVLRRGERREVQLDDELRVLEPYLDISRARFGDRLTVSIETQTEAGRALVPFFILQPLVENALHHGVSSRSGPATVRVTAAREGDRLALTVSDDGPGADQVQANGIGLSNTRARLTEMYGDLHALDIGRPPGGGFRVRIEIPFREGSGAP